MVTLEYGMVSPNVRYLTVYGFNATLNRPTPGYKSNLKTVDGQIADSLRNNVPNVQTLLLKILVATI